MLSDLLPRVCMDDQRCRAAIQDVRARLQYWDDEDERPAKPRDALTVVGDVGEITVGGVLTRRYGVYQMVFGGYAYEEIIDAAERAKANKSVRGVLLRVNSPGGSVDGLADASDALHALRRVKRVVAQVEGLCASAAYRLASQADEIWAGRADEVGSIGTLWVHYDTSEMAKAAGVEAIVTSTGWMKGAGVSGAPITPEQRAEFQRVVDADNAMFLEEVRRGRRATEAKVRSWATGQTWHAPDAAQMGLIDGVRTLEETRAELRRTLRAEARAANQRVAATMALETARFGAAP